MIINPVKKTDVLKQLWIGTCNIYEYQQVTDPETYQTTNKLVLVAENEPCKLSYMSLQVTELESGVGEVSQVPKLFIRPDLPIKAGSQLHVTQHGVTNIYKSSSEPAIYTNHQEVLIELDKEV